MDIDIDSFNKMKEIQTLELELDSINLDINKLRLEIENINKDFENSKNEWNNLKEEIKNTLSRKKDMENEIKIKEENIKKNQMELNSIKSNDAFKALLIQIDNTKKEMSELETEILIIMEKIDSLNIKEKEFQAIFKEKEAKKNTKIAEINSKISELDFKKNELENKKQEKILTIKPEFNSYYIAIKNKKKPAIVPVKFDKNKYFCGGCNMSLTSQQISDLNRKAVFINCDNCGRMLYMPEEKLAGTKNEEKNA